MKIRNKNMFRRNPKKENVSLLREMVQNGATVDDLKEKGFSDHIISLHYERTIAKLEKRQYDKETLQKMIIEEIKNGKSTEELLRAGYPSFLIHHYYIKTLREKTKEIKMQRVNNVLTA